MKSVQLSVLDRVILGVARKYVARSPVDKGKWRLSDFCRKRFGEADIVARTKFGAKFHCYIQDMIMAYIFFFGIWEPNLTAFMGSHLSPGDTFIDIGSNIGYYSLLASRMVGKQGRVIAVDASPRIFELLLRNLQLNGASNVVAHNVAISSEEGPVPIYLGPSNNLGKTSMKDGPGQRLEGLVHSSRLMHLLTRQDIASVRMVKIDIEGHEAAVLEEILANLTAFGPKLEVAVEISPPESAEHAARLDSIFNTFARNGFRAYKLRNEYEIEEYFRPRISAIEELVKLPSKDHTDVIFSRSNLLRKSC